jgi:hypothetical protein
MPRCCAGCAAGGAAQSLCTRQYASGPGPWVRRTRAPVDATTKRTAASTCFSRGWAVGGDRRLVRANAAAPAGPGRHERPGSARPGAGGHRAEVPAPVEPAGGADRRDPRRHRAGGIHARVPAPARADAHRGAAPGGARRKLKRCASGRVMQRLFQALAVVAPRLPQWLPAGVCSRIPDLLRAALHARRRPSCGAAFRTAQVAEGSPWRAVHGDPCARHRPIQSVDVELAEVQGSGRPGRSAPATAGSDRTAHVLPLTAPKPPTCQACGLHTHIAPWAGLAAVPGDPCRRGPPPECNGMHGDTAEDTTWVPQAKLMPSAHRAPRRPYAVPIERRHAGRRRAVQEASSRRSSIAFPPHLDRSSIGPG